ncbi:MAG: hypothetical protein J5830_04795 [Clostridia bacterium]|nr:hypothetical protein [Clostridia bacterium]
MGDESKKALIFDTTTFETVGNDPDAPLSSSSDPEGKEKHVSKGTEYVPQGGGFSIKTSPEKLTTYVKNSDVEPATDADAEEDESSKKKAAKKEKKREKAIRREESLTENERDEKAERRRRAERRERQSVRMDRIRFDPENIYTENRYFTSFAKKYTVLKLISMVLAAAFAFTMLAVFGSSITTDNFKYLLKDIDFSSLNTGSFESMYYSGGLDALFAVYRGDLVVVNPGSTSLYKGSGARAFYLENEYYSPALVAGSKYFLVYDSGNTSYGYTVYNSFTALSQKTMSNPITCGTICDEGSYVLVTRDENYKSIICVFDRDLRNCLEIRKDKYTVSVDLSPDGKKLYTAALYDLDGDYSTEITVVDIESGTEDITITVDSVVPMIVKCMNGGGFAVVYTDRIIVYGDDGIKLNEVLPVTQNLVRAYAANNLICLTCNAGVVGDEKEIRVFDTRGKETIRVNESGELIKIASNDGCVLIMFQEFALKIDPSTGKTYRAEILPNALELVFASNGEPFVCYTGSALPLDFKEQNKG